MSLVIKVIIVNDCTLRPSNVNWRYPGRLALLALATTLVAVAGIGHGLAREDSSPQFTNMAVSVMPEYDQPSVLVSYRGDLNPDVSLPLQTRLRLPADAEVAQVPSIKQPGEEHICQPYSPDPDGPYLAVTWEAVTPTMYVEFYYGSISGARQVHYFYQQETQVVWVATPRGAEESFLSDVLRKVI